MQDRRSRPIGIFDSGVGGLTVLTVLKNELPHENFLYVGDTLNNPYGQRSAEDITELSLRMVDFLTKHDVKMAVVACNTITVTAFEQLRKETHYPLIGVCKGMHTAIDISPKKRIGVMATSATINTHKHLLVAKALDDKVTVMEQPCPDLAQLIETGHIDDALMEERIDAYLDPFIAAGVDTVIMGCTHFPFVKKMMERKTGHDIVYVDPAYETAEEVVRVLQEQQLFNKQIGEGKLELCFTSELATVKRLVSLLLPPKSFTLSSISLP